MTENVLTDETLASEDWKWLFLITLCFLVFALGWLLEIKLEQPIEYCTKDYCIRKIGDGEIFEKGVN